MTIDNIITLLMLTPTMAVPVLLLVDLWRDRHDDTLFKPVAVAPESSYNQSIDNQQSIRTNSYHA